MTKSVNSFVMVPSLAQMEYFTDTRCHRLSFISMKMHEWSFVAEVFK